jgi:ABC-type transport system involved in multi-copper enzyme maturation permease subunit
MAELFFLAVSGTQLALVLLAAPAATAGAICLDRARGTLSHMLMTDLSDSEIVLGKLTARLIPVVGLLACLLPVMELLALLGGVDPGALLGGFAVSFSVAVLGCSLALFFSLWVGKTHEALMGTFAVWALWLLGGRMIDLVAARIGWVPAKPQLVADPFYLALAPYWWPKSVDLSDYVWFVATTLAASAILVGIAVLRLRTVCLREKVARAHLRRPANRLHEFWRSIRGRITWLVPSLDGNPVLWREWHRSRPSLWSVIIMGVFGGLSVLCSAMVIISPGGPAGAWVNGLQVSIGLLLLSVASSASLAEERARGSMDLLLSTPLTAEQIVLGKWLGAFRMVPLLAVMPAIVLGCAALATDWSLTWLALLLVVYVLCSGAAITSLGIAMATWFSRPSRAIGVTVTLYAFIAVGWLMVVMVITGGPEPRGLDMGSPFLWAGELTFEVSNRRDDISFAWAIIWTLAWAWTAEQLLRVTLRHFERRLGRMTTPVALPVTPARRLRVCQRIYFWGAIPLAVVALTSEWAPAAAAISVTLGLLMLEVKGASWLFEREEEPGETERVVIRNTVSAAVRTWLAALYRLVVPIVVIMLIFLLSHVRRRDMGFGILLITAYVFSAGAMFMSLGAAIARRRSKSGRTTTSLVVAWAVINGGLLLAAGALGGESYSMGLAVGMGSPFLGVSLLATNLIHPGADNQGVVGLAILWTTIYALAGFFLLQRARIGSARGAATAGAIARSPFPQLTPDN